MPRSDSQKERQSLFGVNGNLCHAALAVRALLEITRNVAESSRDGAGVQQDQVPSIITVIIQFQIFEWFVLAPFVALGFAAAIKSNRPYDGLETIFLRRH
jgi:hypothetical protein